MTNEAYSEMVSFLLKQTCQILLISSRSHQPLGCYSEKHPQLPPSSSTLHTLDLDDPPVTSVSEVPYRLLVTVMGGVAFGARLNGCASTSYGTIAGVLQLYGKYIDTAINTLSHL